MYGKYFRKYFRIEYLSTTIVQLHAGRSTLYMYVHVSCLLHSYTLLGIIVVVVRVVSSTCVKIISYEDIMHITNEVKVLLTYCTVRVQLLYVRKYTYFRKYESTKVRKYLISCTKVTTYYLRTTITVLLYINKITYLY